MSNRNAHVASGARGPIARGENVERDANPRPAAGRHAEPPVREGYKRYRSKVAGYQKQITSPADTFNPSTGQTTKHLRKVAKFSALSAPIGDARGQFETNDPQIIESLEKSRFFGRGLDFWLADEQDAQIASEQIDKLRLAIDNLQNPELQREMLEKLNTVVAVNFTPPPAKMPAGNEA